LRRSGWAPCTTSRPESPPSRTSRRYRVFLLRGKIRLSLRALRGPAGRSSASGGPREPLQLLPGVLAHATAARIRPVIAHWRKCWASSSGDRRLCCCGATPAHALDPQSASLLGLWNLAHARARGKIPPDGMRRVLLHLRAAREEVAPTPRPPGAALVTLRHAVDPASRSCTSPRSWRPRGGRPIRARAGKGSAGLKVACYYAAFSRARAARGG